MAELAAGLAGDPVHVAGSPETAELSAFELLRARGRLRGVVALLGPAFVAAVAYVDPGNFATNFSAGARFGYSLVWVILVANLMAMLVQYLSAKIGVATGRDLPELCRDHLPRAVSLGLWTQAELVAMATDLAEFVGAAIGLNLLFRLPLLAAGLITAVVAFGILAMAPRRWRASRAGRAAARSRRRTTRSAGSPAGVPPSRSRSRCWPRGCPPPASAPMRARWSCRASSGGASRCSCAAG